VVERRVYVGSDDANLYALTPPPAKSAGLRDPQHLVLVPPSVDGVVTFGSLTGLYAVDAKPQGTLGLLTGSRGVVVPGRVAVPCLPSAA